MNIKSERFFVTGGTGFVGSCLVRKLVELGCDVHLLVRPGSRMWRLHGVERHVNLHHGDLNDAEGLRAIVADIQPTVIYHLGVHGAYPDQNDADRIILTDVFGTWNLLKACAEVDYALFVNTGSSSEYGSKPYAMRETDLLEPNSYYAVAKSAQTLVCAHMGRRDRRPINTFRLFSVYGPYEEPTRLVATVVRKCLEGGTLDMVSPATARDFIHVDDVVDAYMQVGQLSLQCGEIFNIGTGVQSTVREVVEAAAKASGKCPRVNWGSMPARTWDSDTWLADITRVRRTLRWMPKLGLEEGIRMTTDWYREYRLQAGIDAEGLAVVSGGRH